MSKLLENMILIITFTLIVVTGIAFKLPFIYMLPLINSLGIMLLMAHANRYGYIAGGINSIIYAYAYFSFGLYASAASALFFSFPMQIFTFLSWSKNAYKNSTKFKKLSPKARIYISICFIVVWIIVLKLLQIAGSGYAVLDNTSSILGILVTVLTVLAYIEYSYLNLISSAINIFLNVQIVLNDISRLPYAIYSIYCMLCVIMATITVSKIYKEQHKTEEEIVC